MRTLQERALDLYYRKANSLMDVERILGLGNSHGGNARDLITDLRRARCAAALRILALGNLRSSDRTALVAMVTLSLQRAHGIGLIAFGESLRGDVRYWQAAAALTLAEDPEKAFFAFGRLWRCGLSGGQWRQLLELRTTEMTMRDLIEVFTTPQWYGMDPDERKRKRLNKKPRAATMRFRRVCLTDPDAIEGFVKRHRDEEYDRGLQVPLVYLPWKPPDVVKQLRKLKRELSGLDLGEEPIPGSVVDSVDRMIAATT